MNWLFISLFHKITAEQQEKLKFHQIKINLRSNRRSLFHKISRRTRRGGKKKQPNHSMDYHRHRQSSMQADFLADSPPELNVDCCGDSGEGSWKKQSPAREEMKFSWVFQFWVLVYLYPKSYLELEVPSIFGT